MFNFVKQCYYGKQKYELIMINPLIIVTTFDDVDYVEWDDYVSTCWLAFGLSCALWFFIWGVWFHYYRGVWFKRKAYVPDMFLSLNTTPDLDSDAYQIKKFIDEAIDDACMGVSGINDSQVIIANGKKRYKKWIGWEHLRSILYVLYSCGVGVCLYRVPRDKAPNLGEPPEDVEKVTKWSCSNWYLYSAIAVLTIGAECLMALGSFCFCKFTDCRAFTK